jgi:hypothetical protein
MNDNTRITREDIMPLSDYGDVRAARRLEMIEKKKARRLPVGPDATFYFENYETMWHQVHEMLWIEKGGEEQVADELAAYNPLIPNGRELVATLMFEIDDPERRDRILRSLAGVEDTITLELGDLTVPATAEVQDGVERTKADGKTSSIHFIRFTLDDEAAARIRKPGVRAVVAIGHPNYGHMAVLPDNVRAALGGDLR